MDTKHLYQASRIILCLLSGLMPFTGFAAQAPAPSEQLTTEIARLKKLQVSLEEKANENIYPFKQAETALTSGYLYLSLYRLQQLRMGLEPLAYQRSQKRAGITTRETFEKTWQTLGTQLFAKEKPLPARKTPGMVQALTEISQSQIQPYYKSGRLYGINTTVENGLYYLGLAVAHSDFLRFCAQLNFPPAQPAVTLRALDSELQTLETEIIAGFAKAEGTNDQTRYLPVNASLKIAQELNAAKKFQGALLQYLNTCLALNLITAAAVNDETVARLKTQNAAVHKRLLAAKTDQSIGWFYWQLVEYALQQNDAEMLKRAAIISDKLLPRYFKYLGEIN
ncbi:MAG: hypothetical protein AB1757_25450 [Acidobacteriota bacterium]